jgi:hypothetical protein
MQLTQQTSHWTVKNLILLLLLVLAANWFFTFQLVCLKDDNSFYYMPVRMYLSDALHTEGIPYWNPYLMNGVPQHADIQGAVWNPFAFLLAYYFHYNHTCFLVEYLIYIFIAAAGMWRLTSLVTKDKQMLFAAASIYICCGFVSGISNFINWTASLAFIPWLFYCFYVLMQEPSLKKAGWFGFVGWLMVVCGYPAFLIYAAYCMMTFFVWWTWQQIKNRKPSIIIHRLKYLLLAGIVCFILSLPAFFSYIEFFPFYSRGHDLATDVPYRDCFYPQFLASLFIPTSVYNKNFDPLCHSANRDIYFGIVPLLMLVLWFSNFKTNTKGLPKLLLGIGIFTFIFLFGFLTPLGGLAYKLLPLMGSFKWSAAVRIFLIMVIIFAVAIQWKQKGNDIMAKKKLKLLQIVLVVLFVGVIAVFLWINETYLFETPTHKNIFQLNAAVQAVLLLLVFAFIKKIVGNRKWMLAFIVIDLFINYSLSMAMTGVGNVKPAVFNEYANEFYKQNPDGYLDRPLAMNREYYLFDPWHNHNASKILNGATFLESNTVFINYEKKFILDTANEKILRENAFVFSNEVHALLIDSIHLGYTSIDLKVRCTNAGNIILQQNNYFRWREKKSLPINTYEGCFMMIPVHEGLNEIHLYYDKGNYPLLAMISLALLAALLLWLFFGGTEKILPAQRKP